MGATEAAAWRSFAAGRGMWNVPRGRTSWPRVEREEAVADTLEARDLLRAWQGVRVRARHDMFVETVYVTPPRGRSQGESWFQRAIWHPFTRLSLVETRFPETIPTTRATWGPP